MITLALASFGLASIWAQDASTDVKKEEVKKEEKKNEVKFPGKLGLQFTTRADADYQESNPKDKGADFKDAAMYFRNQVKFTMGLDLVKLKDDKGKDYTLYTMTPWLSDRFDLKFNPTYEVTSDSFVLPRNRFYAGLDNTINIPNIIKIGIDFEFRLASDLRKQVNPFGPNEAVEIKFAPKLNLSGSYDFGLSWKLNTTFSSYFFPNMNGDYKGAFKMFEIEADTYKLAFDFLKSLNLKDIKGSVFAEDYFWLDMYADKWQQDANGNKIANKTKVEMVNEFTFGLEFDLFKITPMFAFYLKSHNLFYTEKNSFTLAKNGFDKTDVADIYDLYPGLKVGIGYTKEWFSFSITYYGCQQIIQNGREYAGLDTKYKEKYPELWESHIETAVNFKL